MWRKLALTSLTVAGLTIVSACGDPGDDGADSDPADDVTTPLPAGVTSDSDSEDDSTVTEQDDLFGQEAGSFDARPILPWYMRPPTFHVATDQDELETGWEMYQLNGDLPDVDWDRQNALFLGLVESGTCPWQFDGLSVENDELIGYLDYDMDYSPDDEFGCTSDDNPRSYVVLTRAEQIPDGEPIVRLRHSHLDSHPMRTDTRDIPLREIDATQHDHPFVIWESEPGEGQEPRDRVVDRIEVVAEGESTISMKMEFAEESMLPDPDDSNEFELVLPDESYASTRIGMTIHDASLAFEPPENINVYTAPYRELAVAGRDFHQMMSRPWLRFTPHLGNEDDVTSVQVEIPLEEHEDAYDLDVSVLDEELGIELTITER